MDRRVQVGERVPDLELRVPGENGPEPVRTGEILGTGRVALFSMPGAFTGTCSEEHLPGILRRASDLRAAGADRVVCTAVNDAFVLGAWGEASGVSGEADLLADGNGDLVRALGLELDLSVAGLGPRGQRFAAILDGGVVRWLGVEPGRDVTVSSAESVLAALREGV